MNMEKNLCVALKSEDLQKTVRSEINILTSFSYLTYTLQCIFFNNTNTRIS